MRQCGPGLAVAAGAWTWLLRRVPERHLFATPATDLLFNSNGVSGTPLTAAPAVDESPELSAASGT